MVVVYEDWKEAVMNEENSRYLEVLAECCEEAARLEDEWELPDGVYTCSLKEVRRGVKQKENGEHAWVTPRFVVLEGKFRSHSFTDFIWIPPNEANRGIRQLYRLAQCLAGRRPSDPIEAGVIVLEAVHERLRLQIEVKTNISKGRVYHNIYYRGRAPDSSRQPADVIH